MSNFFNLSLSMEMTDLREMLSSVLSDFCITKKSFGPKYEIYSLYKSRKNSKNQRINKRMRPEGGSEMGEGHGIEFIFMIEVNES